MGCVFCEQEDIQARVIVDTGLARAFPTIVPITPGHTLVVPNRHVGSIAELTVDERNAVFDLAEMVKQALRTSVRAEGFNHAWNENEMAGQSVSHFHLHIVPRTTGDAGVLTYEPRDFLYRPGSRAATPQAELLEVASLIRDAL